MKKEDRKEKFSNECKWLVKKNLLHRGKYDNKNVYENTMLAFKKAVEDKSPFAFEIQLTSDRQVICFYDEGLKRLFNRERLVRDISYKRINKLRDDLQVPLLKDVLKMVDGKVELMIELKNTNHKFNKILVKEVYELLKDYKGKYVIVSFNPFMLASYKKLDKNAYIGRIGTANTNSFMEKIICNKHYFNFIVKPDFISYDVDNYDVKLIEKYKEKGFKIIGWTLKNQGRVKELNKHYDNFIVEE